MTIDQALWILEHQIGPNVYGLKWHAIVTILERKNLMDSWPTSREVEKVKPFAERAQKCMEQLAAARVAVVAIDGETPIARLLLKAVDLLAEAKSRGVKGKEPGDQPPRRRRLAMSQAEGI